MYKDTAFQYRVLLYFLFIKISAYERNFLETKGLICFCKLGQTTQKRV